MVHTYKLLFTDIDGTLVKSGTPLTPLTIAAIQKIKHQIPVVLVSARMPSAITYLQEELKITDQPIICYNGALVIVNQKTIQSTEIDNNTINALVEYGNSTKDVLTGLYYNDDWYVDTMTERVHKEIRNTNVEPTLANIDEIASNWQSKKHGAHKIMFMGTKESMDLAQEFLENEFNGILNSYRSNNTLIEISSKKVSKLSGINALLEQHFKAGINDIIAFGDNYNDIEMLEAVGHGVAVANGRPEAMKAADEVAPANIDDGVAKTILKYF